MKSIFWNVRVRRFALIGVLVLLLWVVLAYLVIPLIWVDYEDVAAPAANAATVTHTVDGIPGDPLNVQLVGTREEVMRIMVAARYYPADPLTLESCLKIAEASVLKRPYEHAPVSNLFLYDRKEDLAFEKPVDGSPRHRHHVRFWQALEVADDGRPIWMGATTYDERVGLSYTTGEFTHHVAPNVDHERDYLVKTLHETGSLVKTYLIPGFHKVLSGRNGEGDPWHTDGNLHVGIIRPPTPTAP